MQRGLGKSLTVASPSVRSNLIVNFFVQLLISYLWGLNFVASVQQLPKEKDPVCLDQRHFEMGKNTQESTT